ncbi:MAG: hypothetical protein AAFO94_13645, partial [Bacteroidota bacterium]
DHGWMEGSGLRRVIEEWAEIIAPHFNHTPQTRPFHPPMVSGYATSNNWLNKISRDIYPPVTQNQITINWRTGVDAPSVIGKIPTRAVQLVQLEDDRLLTSSDVSGTSTQTASGANNGTLVMQTNSSAFSFANFASATSSSSGTNAITNYYANADSGFSTSLTSLVYRMPQYVQEDFGQIRNRLPANSNYTVRHMTRIPAMGGGLYNVKLEYKIPGLGKKGEYNVAFTK